MTDLREIERASIRQFVQSAADDGYLSGRVLDVGCGKQPYRDIVEKAGGEYKGFDRVEFPANVSGEDVGFIGLSNWLWHFDAALCTQVVQYVPMTGELMGRLALGLQPHGHLILTYPTNWPEVEPEDLHRFTKAGMERLLTEAGFEIVRHERRAHLNAPCFVHDDLKEEFALGYGVIARA